MTRPLSASFTLVLAAFFTQGAASQTVENPVYRSWARVPVGTVMVQRTVSAAADGGAIESRTIQKLLSIDDGAAVVEQTYVDPDGEEFPQEFRHRHRVPLLPGVDPETIGRPPGATAEGEETLQVAGRSVEARWYDTIGQAEAGKALIRTWYSDEVPGLVVKAVSRIEGYRSTTTIELVELRVP